MNKPFAAVIAESRPPYAPEALLRLCAASGEGAKKKAGGRISKARAIFVKEGHATEGQIGEEARIVDVPNDEADGPKAASGRRTGLAAKATVAFQKWEGGGLSDRPEAGRKAQQRLHHPSFEKGNNMGQIRNCFGLPVQPGEFIDIRNGVCHTLGYVEEWEDAPEGSSGCRGVFLHGLEIGKLELRARVVNDHGFAELDSEHKQSIAEEPLTQEVFDIWISCSSNPDLQSKPITARQFCERIMAIGDGCYFVKFARGCLCQREIAQIEKEWREFKIREKLSKPDAGTVSNWIDEWLSARPDLDAPWIVDEMITQISLIEEPGGWDGKLRLSVGREAFIREMMGEPQCTGKTGVATHADDAGQIHGTWGGCALAVDDDYDFVEPKEVDENHYHDGYVDVRVIPEFCLVAFTNGYGGTVVVNFDSNLFSPSDLIAAYEESLEAFDPDPEEKEDLISKYRSHLIACGYEKEELENE